MHFAGSVWDAQLICLAFAFSFCGFRVEESIAISRGVCVYVYIYICIRKHIKVCIHIYIYNIIPCVYIYICIHNPPFKNIYLYTYYGQHMGCLFIQLRVLGAQGQEWYRTLEGVVPKI